MRNKNAVNIIALIILMIYVISPVDALPGPVDDMLLCFIYAYLNYRNGISGVFDNNEIDDKNMV